MCISVCITPRLTTTEIIIFIYVRLSSSSTFTMTRTKELHHRKHQSCMFRVQKPLRWLLSRVHKLFYTSKDNNNYCKTDRFKRRSSIPSRISDELSFKKLWPKESESLIIIGNQNDDDQREEDPTLLRLPVQIRQSIYNLIDARDILTLRLTCNAIKEDVESSHGVHLRVHDGRLDYEKALQKFGIAELIVERLIQEDLNHISVFPHPELLKTLAISGPISGMNMEFLLEISLNLTELRLHFQFYDQRIPVKDYLQSHPLPNLQTFHVICNATTEISESPAVLESIQDFLNDMTCPNLTLFKFHVDGLMNNRMREYHDQAYRFITKNESLNKIDVQLRQVGSTATNLHREDLVLGETFDFGPKIIVLHLNMNSNAHLWYPLLDSQACLRSLNLQLSGQMWNRLILILDKNARTLMNLKVTGLCSTTQDGVTTLPVDFGLLRNLKALQNLEIEHINMESRGAEPPQVLRTSSLPQLSLRTVKLCHLRLKPHQAMFLLVKLPLLEKLELECWSDTEGSLGGYLSVVTFLIKFSLTPVKSIELMDSRRRMENQQYEINKLIKTLLNVASITQTNTELYSTVYISRYNM